MHFISLKRFLLRIGFLLLTSYLITAAAANNTESLPSTNSNNTLPTLESDIIHTPDNGVSLSLQQDTLLLVVTQLKLYHAVNTSNAVALELDGGPRVIRANGTYALALNDHNRFKVSEEYLSEALDFDFASGDTRQWVQQGAVGAAYEYLLSNSLFQDVSLGTHYSQAANKELSTVTTPLSSGGYLTDERRIAGGKDFNGDVETLLKLWKNTDLTLGTVYDRVRYDMEYDDTSDHDAQGFGGHARLEQQLRNNIDMDLDTTVSQLFDSYGVGFNWKEATKKNTHIGAGLNSSYTQDHTTERNFWVNSISISVVWDPPENKSSQANNADKSLVTTVPLTLWVQTPAVRMPDVLAVADEYVGVNGVPATFVPVVSSCPAGIDLQYANGSYSASGGWYQSYPAAGTAPATVQFNPAFDSANIMTAPSGTAACFYILNGNANTSLILENSTFEKVQSSSGQWLQGSYSQFWPLSQTPEESCMGVSDKCQFQTVA